MNSSRKENSLWRGAEKNDQLLNPTLIFPSSASGPARTRRVTLSSSQYVPLINGSHCFISAVVRKV